MNIVQNLSPNTPSSTVKILNFWTDMFGQTVQTQIRLTAPRGALFAIPFASFNCITHGRTSKFEFSSVYI